MNWDVYCELLKKDRSIAACVVLVTVFLVFLYLLSFHLHIYSLKIYTKTRHLLGFAEKN